MARNNNFNLVDFYNSLEQNYKQSTEGEAKLHGKGDILDPLVKMLFSSGSADTAMAPAMSDWEYHTGSPMPAQYSNDYVRPTGQGIIEFSAHDEINKLIAQNKENEKIKTLLDYLSIGTEHASPVPPRLMPR